MYAWPCDMNKEGAVHSQQVRRSQEIREYIMYTNTPRQVAFASQEINIYARKMYGMTAVIDSVADRKR